MTDLSTHAGSATEPALERAVAFLRARQRPNGEIPVQAAGKLDPAIFPTAVAAHALSFAPRAADVRERALAFLRREMDPGGLWRHWPREHPHHRVIPPDLDDTACASAALQRAGIGFPENRARLLANRRGDALFRTWAITWRQRMHPLRLHLFFRHTSAHPGDVDAVVNANVLFYLGAGPQTRSVVEHLLGVLREDAEQRCDKWYDNPFVVWYFFSRALRGVSPEAGELVRRKIAAARPVTPLEEALAACALACWGVSCDPEPLLRTQLPSGGWPAAPLYHGGRARLPGGGFAAPHPDTPYWGSEELTTVFCVEALARAGSRPRRSS